MKSNLQFVLAITLVASFTTANAADLAVLRNGNTIRHERREIVGAVTRLYLSDSSSGYIEVPTTQIERFEKDTAPPPVKSQPKGSPAKTQAAPQAQLPTPTQLRPQTQLSPAMTRQDLNELISGAGERHQIDPDFINSVIRAESGFHQNAVSKKGAQGLMQLMPGTASELGVNNAFDPHANVEGGTKYLRELLEKYNYDVPKALAAYNAGPKRVDQYRGVPPYYETQAYIARIIRDFNRQKLAENPALARQNKTTSTRGVKRGNVNTPAQAHRPVKATAVPKGPESASK